MPIPLWLLGAGVAALLTAAATSSDDDDDDSDADLEQARRSSSAANLKARKEAKARALVDDLRPRLRALLATHDLDPKQHDVMLLLGDPWTAEAELVEAFLDTPEMRAIDHERRELRREVLRLHAAHTFLMSIEEEPA